MDLSQLNPLYLVVSVVAAAGAILTAGIWVGRVNEHRKNVADFMTDIRDDIENILSRLETR